MTTIPKKATTEKTAVEKSSAAAGSDDALRTRGLRLTGPRRVVLEVVRRVERITDDAKIQDEIVHGALLPRPGELSAPLMIEIADKEQIKLAAVHFVRFPFPAAAVRAFADSPAFLVVDHPAARARVELSAERKAALSEDLLR